MAKKEAKTNKENKKESKNKKSFLKGFKAELKKVIWPTPKQLVNNTTAVIVIVLITAAIVFVLDLTFETINKHGIDKIKEVIEASQEETTEDSEAEEDETAEEVTDENQETSEEVTDENQETSEEGQDAQVTENSVENEASTENTAE